MYRWLIVAVGLMTSSAFADGPTARPMPVPNLKGVVRVAPSGNCGGAAIADDDPGPQLEPAPGLKLLIRRGTTNSEAQPIASVTTGANGTFTASVPPGK